MGVKEIRKPYSECQKCGSKNFKINSLELEDNEIEVEQEVQCKDCGHVWYYVFTLTHYED